MPIEHKIANEDSVPQQPPLPALISSANTTLPYAFLKPRSVMVKAHELDTKAEASSVVIPSVTQQTLHDNNGRMNASDDEQSVIMSTDGGMISGDESADAHNDDDVDDLDLSLMNTALRRFTFQQTQLPRRISFGVKHKR